MKKIDTNLIRITALLFFICFLTQSYAQLPNEIEKTLSIEIKEGVCYFHGIKIGDKISDVQKVLGKTNLITAPDNDELITHFYPRYGMKLSYEGDYVRRIFLYPVTDSPMGDISKFHIFSKNKNTWKHGNLLLNKAQPQDIMQIFGTENMNTKIGSSFTSAISNNVMGYKIVNSGGTQDLIFYFDGSNDELEHIANRLGK